MNRLLLTGIVLAVFAILAQPALAREVPLTEYNALRHVDVSRNDAGLNLRFEFKNRIQQEIRPRYYKRSVQLDFDLTYVDPPKRYYPVDNSPLTQVYVSQFDSRMMRMRLILGEENALGKGDFKFIKTGNVLIVRVKDKAAAYDDSLDALLERAVGASRKPVAHAPQETRPLDESQPESNQMVAASNELQPGVASRAKTENAPDSIFGKGVEPLGDLKEEEIVTHKPSVPLQLKDSKPDQAVLVANKPELEGNSLWTSAIKMISTLAFVIGLMFLIFHLFKKWVGKQGMFGGGEKSIRVISTGFLGPKKSIAMVEVAGKVLILGVANDQITLLSSLEEEEEVQRILNGTSGGEKKENSRAIVIPSTKEKQSARNVSDGKADIYTSQVKKKATGSVKNEDRFSGYVKEYAAPEKKKTPTVNDLKRMIRQRSGKVKVEV